MGHPYCDVIQLPFLDYTEPAFQLAAAATDSLSQVNFLLDIGITPGGCDVMKEEKLGGPLTRLSRVAFTCRFAISE